MVLELARLRYLKLESGNIIHKARALLEAADGNLEGVFGGNSGMFLPEEIEARCIGTMPACYMPEVFRRTWDLLEAGRIEEASLRRLLILSQRSRALGGRESWVRGLR